MNDSLYFLSILPIIGVCIKRSMDAWSKTNKHSNTYAVSSIVQYSLMTLYLAIAIIMVGRFIHKNSGNTGVITNNLKWFFGSLCFLLVVYVAIIVLQSVYYNILQHGLINLSIDESINNYVMYPMWIMLFYNIHAFIACHKMNNCSPYVGFLTLTVIGFGLIQSYLVVNSFNRVIYWPTDDINLPPLQLNI